MSVLKKFSGKISDCVGQILDARDLLGLGEEEGDLSEGSNAFRKIKMPDF